MFHDTSWNERVHKQVWLCARQNVVYFKIFLEKTSWEVCVKGYSSLSFCANEHSGEHGHRWRSPTRKVINYKLERTRTHTKSERARVHIHTHTRAREIQWKFLSRFNEHFIARRARAFQRVCMRENCTANIHLSMFFRHPLPSSFRFPSTSSAKIK